MPLIFVSVSLSMDRQASNNQ